MTFNAKFFVIVCLSPVILVTICKGQLNSSPGAIAVKAVEMNDRTLNILPFLADKYKVVIGVYGTLIGSDGRKINISIPQGTVADVLNAVVAQDPRFDWRQDDNGAIHVTTRESRLQVIEIPIASFDAESLSRTEVVSQITSIPEIASWLNTHHCWMDEIIAGHPPSEWTRFSVHVKNEPLSFVLDEVAGRSRTYFWSAIQYSSAPCAINLRP